MYPLRYDQEKVVFFASPGAEQVFVETQSENSPKLCHGHGWIQIFERLKLLEKPS